MTPEQINLITQSFDKMWPIRQTLAVQFYDRFFEMNPDARRLFPSDMGRLRSKLMDTIAAIVGALENRALLHSIVGHTARHHARFGVSPTQYASFGETLIWSLEQQLGPAFTSDLRQAWIELYQTVQTEMMRGAKAQS
jgi:nitric oxide dioxygenase